MVKKKSERRWQKPVVRTECVLESVTDELAAVIGVLRAVPEMAPGGSDEIAEWAKVLKVRLEGSAELGEVECGTAPAAVARIAAWRLDRVWRVLQVVRAIRRS